MLAWWLFVRQLLNIIRQNNAGYRTLSKSNTHGAVNQVTYLSRVYAHLHKIVSHVFKQGYQVYFLLVAATQCHACLLTYNRQHGLVVELGIVQAIQQMNSTGTRGRNTYTYFAGKL